MAFNITVKEAAALLGVSVGRVHQLISSGTFLRKRSETSGSWTILMFQKGQRALLKEAVHHPDYRLMPNAIS